MTTACVRAARAGLVAICVLLLVGGGSTISGALPGDPAARWVIRPLEDADPTGSIRIDKTNNVGGESIADRGVVQPGDSFEYTIAASCSSIDEDCVDLTVVDTFPPGVVVDESTLPTDIPGFRTVTWADPTLTVLYTEPLTNPAGETGLVAGGGDTFNVRVTVPTTTDLETGDVVTNSATVSAFNVDEDATDPSAVEILVPRTIDALTTKTFSDPSGIAGDPAATTTIGLVATNQSSTNAEVDSMVVEDSSAATWEYLDLASVTVTGFPSDASQAQLFVCPAASAPCDEAEWVAGVPAGPPTPVTLALPLTVPANQVVGVRVVFTTSGDDIITAGSEATIDVDAALRETVRSSGESIDEIPTTTTIDNCATTSVTDPELDPASVTSDPACAQYQVLPPTLILVPDKQFFADADGDFSSESGEHAVIGEESGVSMEVTALNDSAFPIGEVVITEPVAPNEFDKFDAETIVLTFPDGAANANVEITYEGGATTDDDYTPPGPTTIDLPAAPRVTSITVTYTGDPAVDGGATIEPDSVAGVAVHGHLNALVDESDVGSLAGVDNCAGITGSGGGIPGTTGTFAGTACATLPIETRNPGAGGDKTASQDVVPVDQPIAFTMTTTNNGNLPLLDLVVSDPPPGPLGVPPLTPIFEYGRFLGAEVLPADMVSRVVIEVYAPADGWQPLGDVDEADYPDVIGVRASIDVLEPTESFDLRIGVISRDPNQVIPPDTVFENCYSVTASGGELDAQTFCAPPLQPEPIQEGAAIDKFISPEVLPRPIPGMDPQTASVQLRVQNEGSITARTLQITDEDADFWDAVDFVGLGTIAGPPVGASDRADRIQVDALTDAGWQDGVPVALASAALPAGVPAADVRGLRFTFSDTSTLDDGYVLTPCTGTPADCAGIVEFDVSPRVALRSTGEPVPDQLLDSATGAFTTRLHPDPDDPALIPEVFDDLQFRDGDPELDVAKTPELTTLQPGQLATFDLVTTNTGTANLPDVTVSDPLPDGIGFDTTFAGDAGQPYLVTWSNLPDDYPEPPPPEFELVADADAPDRVGLVRWTFAGWDMPPNSTVTITFRYALEPGVTEGETIINTVGASSPVDDLVCSDPADAVFDGPYGAGIYCTDPGQATVAAGANFVSRKWVGGNDDLGWLNQSTGALVPVGDPSCLALESSGRTYTTNPCVALVNPGEQFHYVLRVQNAGTESALRMTVVDTFPAPGDTGVLGADRGTEWATRPTLSGPASYTGLTTGEIAYTADASVCTDDLFLAGPGCPPEAWDDGPDADATALRLSATFDPDPLPPGGTVEVSFSMIAPVEIPRVSDPTIAWNSIAHAEVTRTGATGERVLSPLEPLKVGVAALYGNLEVVKVIGEDPQGLDRGDTVFTFAYGCTLSNGSPGATGEVQATPNVPGTVTAIPAGSTCTVWETDSAGGTSSATESDPVTVTIEPSLDPTAPVVSSVTVINDYPLAELIVSKTVENGADPTARYPFAVACTSTAPDGTVVEEELIEGTPAFDLADGESATVVGRPGWRCTVTETDTDDATVTVTEAGPPDDDPNDGVVTMGTGVSVSVVNSYPAPPPTPTVDPAQVDDSGVDPAALARTGGAIAASILLGLGLVGIGSVAVRMERRRAR